MELIENNQLILKAKYKTSTNILYVFVLIALGLTFASLYFLKTTISIKSSGLLQSTIEKSELTIPTSGKIVYIKIADNQSIKQGDTLMKIDASLPGQKDYSLQTRVKLLNQFLQDLQIIAKQRLNVNQTINLKTAQYQASYAQYQQDLQNSENAREQSEATFNRYVKLYHAKVITAEEYEKYNFDLKKASTSKQFLIQKYRNQCQTEVSQYKEELRQLNIQRLEINQQQKLYILKAAIGGSLQNLSGLQNGTYVFANQKIGEISPNTKLIAYCYLKPADIGLIHRGQEVRFNIDAFNYNQWGFIKGKVMDISDDILMLDKQPVFKVKCNLNTDFLQLKNGYKGYLKKGMTFNARFMVAERTLSQLLYDKVDDWLNPNLIAK